MGRFSPTVTPNWGETFANALGQGVNSYLTTRRQKMQDDESMYDRGLRQETDAERMTREGNTAAPIPTIGDQHARLAAALNPTIQEVAPATSANLPMMNQTPRSLGTTTATYTPDQFASALGGDQQIGSRHYRMTAAKQAQVGAAMALQRAELGQKNATTYNVLREAGTLRLGDPGYAGAMGGVKGAEANAETPAMLNRAYAMLPIETQKLVTAGKISLANALAEGRQRGGIEAGLQGQRQTFESGEHGKERTFQAGQTQTKLAGELSNSIAEERNKEGASMLAPLARKMPWSPSRAPLPGTQAALPPLSPDQQARAAANPDYAAFLKTQGYP